MEFSDKYLSEDIIDAIFHRLSYEDMVSFSQITKYTYIRYDNYIKYLIYDFLNTNYKYFKILIQKYKYSENEIFDMGVNAVKGVRIIWGTPMYGYYDLRFLFELIYLGLDIKNEDILKCTKGHINLQLNIQRIKRCVSFNRFETIHNINKEPMLYSLHKMFKLTKTEDKENTYSIEWIPI